MHHIQMRLQRSDFDLSVDVQLPSQGIAVIYGASGSGKTTLLRCVAGLEKQAQGRIEIADEVWQDDALDIYKAVYQRPLGYVFQEASLFDHLDVQANLQFGLKRSHNPQPQVLEQAVSLLGIGALLKRKPHQLGRRASARGDCTSLGDTTHVALARRALGFAGSSAPSRHLALARKNAR